MLQVVIPMAGEGRRFAEAGYTYPKPLIDVAGVTMIQRVMDCLTPSGHGPPRFTLITYAPNRNPEDNGRVRIVPLKEHTQGAVDTLLQAEFYVDDGPVLVANCDQWIRPGVIDAFLANSGDGDASVMVFNSTNPHHSYVKLAEGFVTEVVEKEVISDNAILGVYYFEDSQVLFDYCRKVIANNLRHREQLDVTSIFDSEPVIVEGNATGEFYLSAVLNEFVKDGGELTAFEVDVHDKAMLGTPEELSIFLDKVADGRVTL